MQEISLKGKIEVNTIIILVIILLAFVVIIFFFFSAWGPSISAIWGEENLNSECAQWQAEGCRELLNTTDIKGELKYPTLHSTYGNGLEAAKEKCGCN